MLLLFALQLLRMRIYVQRILLHIVSEPILDPRCEALLPSPSARGRGGRGQGVAPGWEVDAVTAGSVAAASVLGLGDTEGLGG
jgi:hypothetical protein